MTPADLKAELDAIQEKIDYFETMAIALKVELTPEQKGTLRGRRVQINEVSEMLK